MTQDHQQVVAVRMPQVNVNDEEVRLVGWRVEDGGSAVEGQLLAEVETSKSVEEVPSPASGIVRHVRRAGDQVRVGEILACIGPSLEAIDAHLALQAASPADAGPEAATQGITAGALALAHRYGIDPAQIPSQGRIRREDVERFAREKGLAIERPDEAPVPLTNPEETLPTTLIDKVEGPQDLTDHQWAVAQHLARTQARIVASHVAMDVPMHRASQWVEARRKAGAMTGPLPLLIRAAGLALKDNRRLASFRLGRRVYAYRSIDIAYTARSRDGRLFTPVIREVDKRSPEELLQECGRLNMAAFRGQLRAEDLAGGCMTLSLLSETPVLFHIGLQNAYQSTLLTVGAMREQVVWSDSRAMPQTTVTMTLSYDHGLLDGWAAAGFLDHMRKTLANLDPA